MPPPQGRRDGGREATDAEAARDHQAEAPGRPVGPGDRAELRAVAEHGQRVPRAHRAREAGQAWPLPPELDDDGALERLLFPDEGHPVSNRPEPGWIYIHRELQRRHVTKQLLWQ